MTKGSINDAIMTSSPCTCNRREVNPSKDEAMRSGSPIDGLWISADDYEGMVELSIDVLCRSKVYSLHKTWVAIDGFKHIL